jgi:hypothetical protein
VIQVETVVLGATKDGEKKLTVSEHFASEEPNA